MRKVEEPEDSKDGILEGDIKPETKDEDSGCDSDDNATCKNVPPGEEADVRDVIYQLERLGCMIMVYVFKGFFERENRKNTSRSKQK